MVRILNRESNKIHNLNLKVQDEVTRREIVTENVINQLVKMNYIYRGFYI